MSEVTFVIYAFTSDAGVYMRLLFSHLSFKKYEVP